MLSRREAELTLQWVRFIDIGSKDTFPHRTINDIKGRRRLQEYKDMVQNFLEELQPADGTSNGGSKKYFSPPTSPTPVEEVLELDVWTSLNRRHSATSEGENRIPLT